MNVINKYNIIVTPHIGGMTYQVLLQIRKGMEEM